MVETRLVNVKKTTANIDDTRKPPNTAKPLEYSQGSGVNIRCKLLSYIITTVLHWIVLSSIKYV